MINTAWLTLGQTERRSPQVGEDFREREDWPVAQSRSVGGILPRNGRRILLLLFILLVSLGWLAVRQAEAEGQAVSGATTWQVETVETTGHVGFVVEMVVDGQGRPHVATAQNVGGNRYHLLYAGWDGLTWGVVRVGTVATTSPPQIAIALDGAGEPHLFEGGHHFWRTAEGEWTSAAIPFNPAVSVRFVHALTAEGEIHLFGRGWIRTEHLTLAADGTWTSHTTDLFGGLDGGAAQTWAGAVDGLGRIHLLYKKGGQLHHAFWVGETWEETNLAVEAWPPFSLAIDGSHQPHLSYLNGQNRPVYRTLTGEEEPMSGAAATAVALLVDEVGNGRAVWWAEGGQLVEGWRTAEGAWGTAQIGQWPSQPALAVGQTPMGEPILAFYDGYYGDLLVGWGGPAWVTAVVSAVGSPTTPAFALLGDVPAVAFNTTTHATLATWQAGAWQTEPLAAVQEPAIATPLYYDSTGQPHLAYYDANSRALMYATATAEGWQSEVAHTLPISHTLRPTLFVRHAQYGAEVWVAYTFVQEGEIYLGVAQRVAQGVWEQSTQPSGAYVGDVFAVDVGLLGDGTLLFFYGWQDGLSRAAVQGQTWAVTRVLGGVLPRHVAVAIDTRIRPEEETGLVQAADTETVALVDGLTGTVVYVVEPMGVVNSWIGRVVGNAPGAKGVAVVHPSGAWGRPTLAAIGANNEVVVWTSTTGQAWTSEVVAPATSFGRSHLALAFAVRERLVWLEDGPTGTGVYHSLRRAPFLPLLGTGQAMITSNKSMVQGLYSGGCLCLFVGLNTCAEDLGYERYSVVAAYVPTGNVLLDLTNLFRTSAEGEAFATTYLAHDYEIWTILAADPVLLWDGMRTLNNLWPGLEALTQGRGAQVEMTGEMMAQALAVWQAIAAEASPARAGEINGRLAATDNLQDYAGLSFAEWATTLGVEAPSYPYAVYLPISVTE